VAEIGLGPTVGLSVWSVSDCGKRFQ